MSLFFLGLGSNLGEREKTLAHAREELAVIGTISLASCLYVTEPLHIHDQPWFLNQVIALQTDLEPLDLLNKAQAIEHLFGRERLIRFGPRTLDIDLLLAKDHVLDTPTLTLPHPRLTERRFVLVPFAEIAPDVIHPLTQKTIKELLTICPDSSQVQLLKSL